MKFGNCIMICRNRTMENYKLDRKTVSQKSFIDADDHISYYENKSLDERMEQACFIINNIFQVTSKTKVDRTIFEKRKHGNI